MASIPTTVKDVGLKISTVTQTFSPEYQTNGTFDSDIDGWVGFAGWDYETAEWSAGTLHVENTAGGGFRSGPTFAVSSGITYKVTFTINRTSGALPKWCLASSASGALLINGYMTTINGANTFYVTATGTSSGGRFFFYNYTASDFTIDDVSVREFRYNPFISLQAFLFPRNAGLKTRSMISRLSLAIPLGTKIARFKTRTTKSTLWIGTAFWFGVKKFVTRAILYRFSSGGDAVKFDSKAEDYRFVAKDD